LTKGGDEWENNSWPQNMQNTKQQLPDAGGEHFHCCQFFWEHTTTRQQYSDVYYSDHTTAAAALTVTI